MANFSRHYFGIDVMTTETTCLSSIWKTDDKIKEFYEIHGRSEDFAELNPGEVAYYDGCIKIDLSKIRPMIAMPFHPSNIGGWANIANEYATKRYRSNFINWGMLPFIIKEGELPFKNLDYIYIPGIRKAVEEKADTIKAYVIGKDKKVEFDLTLGELTDEERQIILKGCLINYNRI